MPFWSTSRPLLTCALIGAAAATLAGCQSTEEKRTEKLSAETSVRPGINTEFFKPTANFTEWVERPDYEGRELFEKRDAIIRNSVFREGTTVAQIGGRSGLFTTLIADAVGSSGHVYAIDISPQFLLQIEQRARDANVFNIQTVLSKDKSANIPTNSVDKVFMCSSYHHIEYPMNTLESIYMALKERGEIVLIDFKRNTMGSSRWIVDHVRAGQEVVTQEIEAAGFQKISESTFLNNSYFLRFRKIPRK